MSNIYVLIVQFVRLRFSKLRLLDLFRKSLIGKGIFGIYAFHSTYEQTELR